MNTSPGIPESKPAAGFARVEDFLSTAVLALTALLPCIQVIARKLSLPGIRGSAAYVQHLVLWTAFLCGSLTAREGKHLALTVASDRIPERGRAAIRVGTSLVSVFFGAVFAFSSLSFALQAFPGETAGAIPIWILALVMPAGFGMMTARFIAQAARGPLGRWIAAFGLLAAILASADPLSNLFSSLAAVSGAPPALAGAAAGLSEAFRRLETALSAPLGWLFPPLVVLLIAAALFGAPIFVLLGGLAILLFIHSGGSLEVVSNQAYTMLSASPIIPALPLFTLAGYIISESKAGERLVRLFRGLFGWLPGGLTVMSILICAFLTTFMGASGVTILAVGGLLYYVLAKGAYRESFSTGLLTASGSIGLLFPPSLAVILYGVVAQVDIRQMFLGGVLPGVFMVVVLSAMGVYRSVRDKVPRVPFDPKEALKAFPGAALEILLPFFILFFFFRGIMTLVETAAFSVVYAFVVEVIVHRDIPWRRVPEVFVKCALVMGGVLIIISMANALQYYVIDAQIPGRLAGWLHGAVASRYVFLLLLNLTLLVVGCFMDIYSAITVVAPLIIPIAQSYGIHPVHLGIIFLANLELGYLTPPVGLNLYLASYRFNQPLSKVVRNVVPFLLVLLFAVLVITYVPGLTTFLLGSVRF